MKLSPFYTTRWSGMLLKEIDPTVINSSLLF